MPSRVRISNDSPPVIRTLFSLSLGLPLPRDPRPAYSASLLSHAHHQTYLHTHTLLPPPIHPISPHDLFPCETYNTDTYQHVDLRHYPSGAVVDTLPQGYRMRPGMLPAFDYRPSDAIFAYTLHDQFDVDVHGIQHSIRLVQFPRQPHDSTVVSGELRNSVVYALSLAPSGWSVAATESSSTCVYSARDGTSRLKRTACLSHPDYASGCVTRFFDIKRVLTGTRAGNLYAWDLRQEPQSGPVWLVSAANKNGKVHDMRVSRCMPEVYVSVAGDRTSDLAVWDMRMEGEASRRFETSGRWRDAVSFDVDESGSGGVLAAGGSDCRVGLYESRKGGKPVEVISFGTERPQRVILQGWGGRGLSRWPGLLVETEIQGYIFEVEGRGENW